MIEMLREHGLSAREIQVVEQIMLGLRNKEAASNLCVAEKTIKFHLTNVFKKLIVKSRAQLIVLCAKATKASQPVAKPKAIPKPESRVTEAATTAIRVSMGLPHGRLN